jgi:hypothetical protein
MKIAVVAFASLLLGGCVSAEKLAAIDDQKCQSYGARPGSDAYTQCRVAMDNQRATDRSMRRAAIIIRD